jgi:hypothetical protein
VRFQRVAKISVEEGMDLIRAHMHKSKSAQRKRVNVGGFDVSLNSLRLYTFATHPPCCSNPECTVRADYFAVEMQTSNDGRPVNSHHQLNLYGIDDQGNRHMMTHDHTLARSLGGEDNLTNTSAMCSRCNKQKSVFESQEVERRRRVEAGKLPFMPEVPAPESGTAHYMAELTEIALAKGMEPDQYRSYCALMGTTLGPPLKKITEEQGFARAIRLSRAGLRMHLKIRAQMMQPGADLVEEDPAHTVDFDGELASLAPIRSQHHRRKP